MVRRVVCLVLRDGLQCGKTCGVSGTQRQSSVWFGVDVHLSDIFPAIVTASVICATSPAVSTRQRHHEIYTGLTTHVSHREDQLADSLLVFVVVCFSVTIL